ncbi:50S ribosomal protein L4 [Opitutales bacterium]|jgi:large subunit ribosomal protein L4|nr:50S ribosomal protein L4 [Opitutales bacterium]
MKFKLFKKDGSSAEDRDIENFPSLDEGKGVDALRQCILAVRANKRQGNASTKTRDEVSGSGKKIYRQKGLGTGRAGDKRAIQRTGGGVAFGPKPRSYNQKTNTKVRKLALTRALVDHASDGAISLIEDWAPETHKTKDFLNLLVSIGSTKKTLIIDDLFEKNTTLAARNLKKVKLSKAIEVSAIDIISADLVICSLKGMSTILNKLNTVHSEKS